MHYLDQSEPDEILLKWLAGLGKQRLAHVLTKRPDVLAPPWPRRLGELASRLAEHESATLATRHLRIPGVEVLSAIQLCLALGDGNGAPVAEVAGWLGVSIADATLAVAPLAELALAWIDKAGLVQAPEVMHGNAYARYGLGRPLAPELSRLNAEHLKNTSRALGTRANGRKQQLIDGLVAFFRDGERVRKLVANAPDGVAELLANFVTHGPDLGCDLGYSRYYGGYGRAPRTETPAAWAVRHHLLMSSYDGAAHLPLEVGLALRGPDYTLPFTPHPPALPVAPVAPERVAAETSAAALRLLDRTATVVEAARTEPFPLLKNGTVGTRVIKKLAKETGATTDEIQLVLELAFHTALLAAEEPPPGASKPRSRKVQPTPPATVVPTAEFARWRGESSGTQLRTLLSAWWLLPTSALGDDKAIRAVLGDEPSAVFAGLRHLTMRLLVELEPGTGVIDEVAFVDLVGWHAPVVTPGILRTLVTSSLAEAALVGTIASNAAGELARALVTGGAEPDFDAPELVKATEELVAGACATALFGTDLTAVVTGPPSTELAALLDRVADRETQGSASTWRFSPASVRSALDNRKSSTALLDELDSVARGKLPQPLTYLINDVARRHGEVGVIDIGSVIVGENPGLLAEIAAHRKLAKLGVRSVAPTVLTSIADAATTLAALRDAGYAPVHRSPDGAVVVRHGKPPAAVAEPVEAKIRRRPVARTVAAQDPVKHAERLLKATALAPGRLKRGALMGILPEHNDHHWMRLAWQLEAGFPVWVNYEEPVGQRQRLLISHPELHGDAIDVWCDKPAGYRRLKLSKISPGREA